MTKLSRNFSISREHRHSVTLKKPNRFWEFLRRPRQGGGNITSTINIVHIHQSGDEIPAKWTMIKHQENKIQIIQLTEKLTLIHKTDC